MISAKIIADSIHYETGTRLTTFEVMATRYILSEINTHKMISKNSASSRAVPIKANIEYILENTAYPVSWGKNQSGMVADEKVSDDIADKAKEIWTKARDSAIGYAQELSDFGIHKQLANRLIENFSYQKIVMSGTEWDNFFWLRAHCYSDDTEMLTPTGWKLIRDMGIGDDIYTLNPQTTKVELSKVKNTTSWVGDGNAVSVNGKSTDLLVSDKHKLAIYTNGEIQLVDASSLIGKRIKTVKGNVPREILEDTKSFKLEPTTYTQSNQYKIIKDVELAGRDVDLDTFSYFLGFYLGNGWSSSFGGNYTVSLCKGGKYASSIIDKISKCVKQLSPHSVSVSKKDSVDIISVSDKVLYEYVRNFGKSYEKQIPLYVWDFPQHALLKLYEGMMDADSNWLSTNKGLKYSTSSKCLADDMQHLCMLIGKCATITTLDRIGENSSGVGSNGKPYNITTKRLHYSVSISDNLSQKLKVDAIKEVNNYFGRFVCVTANKNNIIYVRRNGKSIWSGNCDAQPEIQELARVMLDAYNESTPKKLGVDEWHLPYVTSIRDSDGVLKYYDSNNTELSLDDAIKISASCCAQTSYRKSDDTLDKAFLVFDRLNLTTDSDDVRRHSSPVEHIGTPIEYSTWDTENTGVTHTTLKDNKLWSANFKDFIQYRHLIPNESCKNHPDIIKKEK